MVVAGVRYWEDCSVSIWVPGHKQEVEATLAVRDNRDLSQEVPVSSNSVTSICNRDSTSLRVSPGRLHRVACSSNTSSSSINSGSSSNNSRNRSSNIISNISSTCSNGRSINRTCRASNSSGSNSSDSCKSINNCKNSSSRSSPWYQQELYCEIPEDGDLDVRILLPPPPPPPPLPPRTNKKPTRLGKHLGKINIFFVKGSFNVDCFLILRKAKDLVRHLGPGVQLQLVSQGQRKGSVGSSLS